MIGFDADTYVFSLKRNTDMSLTSNHTVKLDTHHLDKHIYFLHVITDSSIQIILDCQSVRKKPILVGLSEFSGCDKLMILAWQNIRI